MLSGCKEDATLTMPISAENDRISTYQDFLTRGADLSLG